MNVKVFNVISKTNETRYMKCHETCKCECGLDASVSNNKQRWNEYKCRCECKEVIEKWICDKGFNWHHSNCEYECNKSCDIGEYLDYRNCKFGKRLVDKLVEECNKNFDLKELHPTRLNSNKMIDNLSINDDQKSCSSCESST